MRGTSTARRMAATSSGPSARIPPAPPRTAQRARAARMEEWRRGLPGAAWQETMSWPRRRAITSRRTGVTGRRRRGGPDRRSASPTWPRAARGGWGELHPRQLEREEHGPERGGEPGRHEDRPARLRAEGAAERGEDHRPGPEHAAHRGDGHGRLRPREATDHRGGEAGQRLGGLFHELPGHVVPLSRGERHGRGEGGDVGSSEPSLVEGQGDILQVHARRLWEEVHERGRGTRAVAG